MKFFTSDPLALYNTEITSTVPDSAVEISDDQYATLIAGQENGKIISTDENGFPCLVEPPQPTQAELIASAEAKKVVLRANADSEIEWRQDAVDAEIATEEETAVLADWKKYRVLLMRVDTAKPVWPTPPGGQAI
ncbi:TPA: tail fiber assembly protein [Citrobacter amalonaticus]|uniref:tail fiber assembly protein n=1 Tax=Citrobacter amalonaticus TaxID=35703 RepID=UPI001C529B03|nr:tail fiber assembly protein [Citrobacter amalonaticus]EGT3573961.1 tail fiber assembly protein [Citrobacter amalonaticus]MBW0868925.1 tail fiber assembly protein [Citrobacter amalonaticus]HEM8624477.1 tail fiber assembly protein [Citrobacter amalonaticus]